MRTSGIEKFTPVNVFSTCEGQKLEGDRLTKFEIIGAVDFTHTTAPQQRNYTIALCDHMARRKSMRRR